VYQALGPDGANESLHIIGVSFTPTFDQLTDEPTAMLIAESQVSPVPSTTGASVIASLYVESWASLNLCGISDCALACTN
jgi:hypothetical protein